MADDTAPLSTDPQDAADPARPVLAAGTPPADGAGIPDQPAAPAGEGERTAPDFPEDWRERVAEGDEDLARLMKRFGSVKAVARALKETRAQLSRGVGAPLPEDAGEEEKAAWRRARGVPDTPQAYDIAPPVGLDWTEADKAYLEAFTTFAHAKHWSQDQVKDLAQWYMDDQIARTQDQAVAARTFAAQTEKELRAAHGRDYGRTLELARAFGSRQLGGEAWEALVHARMQDGTYLGDQPGFINLILGPALEQADSPPYDQGTVTGGVGDAEAKAAHRELVAKANSGDRAAKVRLADPDYERRIGAVYERQARVAERGPRGG
ncbi:hypothetical protein [Labrys wisconsinensis]|uniref:Capsid assembly protein n=1 Tax=Labrys wisconsinensis TaxID=425677 RepID=A0ABU0JL51_9HYPH|nr:hypothetical protein [Labrys wisconsinensis]MDQ0475026.1 hypothetical protein [Labrys wisconsinensis]